MIEDDWSNCQSEWLLILPRLRPARICETSPAPPCTYTCALLNCAAEIGGVVNAKRLLNETIFGL